MAVSKFCHLVGLAAVLACLLIGTVACNDEDKDKQERTRAEELLKSELTQEMEPEDALKKLKEFKWADSVLCKSSVQQALKFGHSSLVMLTVEKAIALSDPAVEQCNLTEFKDLKHVVRKYNPQKLHFSHCSRYKGLFNYLEHYFKKYAQFCLDNFDQVPKLVLSEEEQEKLKEFADLLDKNKDFDKKQLEQVIEFYAYDHWTTHTSSKDNKDELWRICKKFLNQVFDFRDVLKALLSEDRSFHILESHDRTELDDWPHLRRACKMYPDPEPEETGRPLTMGGGSEMGLVM